MKKILVFLVLALASFTCIEAQDWASDSLKIGNLTEFAPSSAETSDAAYTKQMGDSAYLAEDYSKAIEVYEAILGKGESSQVYYNLGNSYFKNKDIAHAILNYERAYLLDPSDQDLKANLEIARARTVDQVDVIPDLFFVSWYKSLANARSERSWSIWAIACFCLALLSAAFYLVSKTVARRKAGFALSALFLVLCLVFNLMASGQKDRLENRNQAIVMEPSVTVRSTPSETGTSVFVLHEGRKVTIKDDSMNQWKEISLEDGKVGWIPTSAIEVI